MLPIQIILLLSLIQGIAEFLPISSTGHLLIIKQFLSIPYNTVTFDMALNIGTLLTTMVYFHKDIYQMLVEVKKLTIFKITNYRELLIIKIIIATMPVVIIGYLLMHLGIHDYLKNNHILLAVNLIIFGVILYVADRFNKNIISFNKISIFRALLIGIFQCIALLPGVSRSGSTITAARLLSINKTDGLRFSFLIAIPSTLGAIILTFIHAFKHEIPFQYNDIILGIVFSFLFGLIFIHILLKFISKYSFMVFMIYRIILGILILLII